MGLDACAADPPRLRSCAWDGSADTIAAWTAKLDPKYVVSADSLHACDGSGRSLSDLSRGDGRGAGSATAPRGGASLGNGNFGMVESYLYHGGPVAVKELKAGVGVESIGMKNARKTCAGGQSSHLVLHATSPIRTWRPPCPSPRAQYSLHLMSSVC